MSDVKAIAAVCEQCGGKLMYRNAHAFECEYCGVNYPTEWVKVKVQEITGTVQVSGPVDVSGIETADVLYDRALDWLDLKKKEKAIKVLRGMTEKYPGDRRGWFTLAAICPTEEIVNVVCQIGGDEAKKILKEIFNHVALFCNQIRQGKLNQDYFDMTHYRIQNGNDVQAINYDKYRYSTNNLMPQKFTTIHHDAVEFIHSLPDMVNLFQESSENACYYGKLRQFFVDAGHAHDTKFKLGAKCDDFFSKLCGVNFWSPKGIIGNILISETSGGVFHVTDIVLSKTVIQELFLELDEQNFRGKLFRSGFCSKCDTPNKQRGFINKAIYCPDCDGR